MMPASDPLPAGRRAARVRTACLAVLALALTLAPTLSAQQPSSTRAMPREFVVECGTLVIAPGEVVSPGALLVRDGKIAHVGGDVPADVRGGARVLRFPGATIVPGFVLAHATLEQERDLAERALAWTPDLHAAEAFDPYQDQLLELPHVGVTSCLLAPSSDNVAGGIAALVKPGAEFGRVALDDSYLKLSLSAAARDQNRAPTSLMGAIDLLRTALQEARAGVVGGPDLAAVRQVLQNERRAAVHADTNAELLAILELAREFEFEPLLLGAQQVGECIDRVVDARARVALRPLRPEMRRELLELPRLLEQRGVAFCFLGNPKELRAAAALAVRHGTSREAALAAITATPAELLGLDQVGVLRRGRDADFAAFSGDPLDLSSQLLATFVDGALLSGAPPTETTPGPDLAAAKESN